MGVTLEVAYGDAAALKHDAETQLARGGLYVVVDASRLPPLCALTLRLIGDGFTAEAAARLTVATGQAACVEVEAAPLAALLAAVARWVGDVAPAPGLALARFVDDAADGGAGVGNAAIRGVESDDVADAGREVDDGAEARADVDVAADAGVDGDDAADVGADDIDDCADVAGAAPSDAGDGAAACGGATDGAADGASATGATADAGADTRGRIALDRKIAAMSVGEKIQLALHGNRDARQLLMRDRAGVVQSSLVRNPKITLDEVQALARAPQLAPDAAETMAQHPTYGLSPQVALALVRNPRTPLPVATQLVARLQPADLRAVAKGLGVRMQVAAAARKRLVDR